MPSSGRLSTTFEALDRPKASAAIMSRIRTVARRCPARCGRSLLRAPRHVSAISVEIRDTQAAAPRWALVWPGVCTFSLPRDWCGPLSTVPALADLLRRVIPLPSSGSMLPRNTVPRRPRGQQIRYRCHRPRPTAWMSVSRCPQPLDGTSVVAAVVGGMMSSPADVRGNTTVSHSAWAMPRAAQRASSRIRAVVVFMAVSLWSVQS